MQVLEFMVEMILEVPCFVSQSTLHLRNMHMGPGLNNVDREDEGAMELTPRELTL